MLARDKHNVQLQQVYDMLLERLPQVRHNYRNTVPCTSVRHSSLTVDPSSSRGPATFIPHARAPAGINPPPCTPAFPTQVNTTYLDQADGTKGHTPLCPVNLAVITNDRARLAHLVLRCAGAINVGGSLGVGLAGA